MGRVFLGRCARAGLAWAMVLGFLGAPTAGQAQLVQLRPIDQATVRILGVSGVEAVQVTIGGVQRTAFHPKLSHGSGVVVDTSGRVLTAAHVVRDLDLLAVVLPGQDDEHPGVVAAIDRRHDIAFVQVPGPLPAAVSLPDQPPSIAPGQTLQVTGYPIDVSQRFPAAASGSFSRARNDGLIELALSLNPGNSGGPVVDAQGALVGVISARGDLAQGIQGIAVAEPIDRAIALVDKIDPDATAAAEGATEAVRWALSLDRQGVRRDASFPEDAPPAVAAMAAHRAWANALLLLSEHSVALPAALPPSARGAFDKEMAILDEALALAKAQGDADIAQRYALAALEREAATVRGMQPPPEPDGGLGISGGSHIPRQVGQEPRDPNRVRRFRLSLGISLPVAPYGFAVRLAFHGDVVSTPYFAVPIGVDFGVGAWPIDRAEGNSLFLGTAMAEVGARARWANDSGHQPFVELAYGVGYARAEGREHFVYKRYRVSLGVERRGGGGYLISYREEGRDADATLRALDFCFLIRF